ncbi:MAG: GNAT family N-acetyltransferase [Pleurocapsa sp.]
MNQKKLKIRPVEEYESELISNLALRAKAYWGYSAEFINVCRRELTYSSDDIKQNYFFGAEINNSIVGFYGLQILSSTTIELEALFIEPDDIGQGYGRKLMEHAQVTASKLGCKLMLIQSDPHARDFYLKLGGKLIGRRESNSVRDHYLPVLIINLSAVSE